ncbi:MAG TPA: rRNA maturation RNase YbeY [Rhizomicrobium sp.]|nr:rRNA maturation RNase YbeY [Rhizomicrobium sp.]
MSIEIRIEDSRWRKARLGARMRRAAEAALARADAPTGAALTILLTGDAALKKLNSAFRGADKPTNVLSFPAAANGEKYLGDVAIAYGIAAAEARARGKRLADHATHLAVHGVLHLLGYDHLTNRQAKIMEPLETEILAKLGIADPYARAA